MFFSSRRKDTDIERASKAAQESARRSQSRLGRPVAPDARQFPVTPRHPDFSDSVGQAQEITDVAALPSDAGYFAFADFPGGALPADYERAFALLRRNATDVLLLRVMGEISGRVEFEIGHRCASNGLKVVERLCVTEEVLKTIHHKHYVGMSSDANRAPSDVERMAFALVESAVSKGASDIHIETRDEKADVFFRIHGERFSQPIMRVLYNVHADSQNSGTQWDPTVVQDTAVERKLVNGTKVQLRFNSAPIYPAPNVQCTLRVLRMDGDQAAKPIEEVGYTPEMIKQIEEMLVGSTGLVLLVGPTNSGKSTSLQSFINRIYERRGKGIKVVTIEDPVEYVIDRACQMGVPRGKLKSEEIARIYKDLLGSTLRQDPDVALVGEIRTNEQAEPVKDMVLAGRKILSTLHAYEAMAVFPRLREIGIAESLLTRAGFVSGVIYQRLVPTLCKECSEPLVPEMVAEGRIRQATYDRVLATSDLSRHDVRVRSLHGCKACNMTGISGRTPCAEILVPDETFLRFVRQGDELAAKNYWHRTGINTDKAGVRVIAHAISKMRQGIVDPTDIEVQVGKIEIDRPEAVPIEARHGMRFTSSEAGGETDLLGLGGRNSSFGSSEVSNGYDRAF
jgi:general secretion pathway protein E